MVICGFAGIGKTKLAEKYPNEVKDLESSNYKWVFPDSIKNMDIEHRKGLVEKEVNPDYVKNYVDDIEKYNKEYKYVLTCIDEELRQELRKRGIPYILVYPDRASKKLYLKRFRERGNGENFINLFDTHFEKFILDLDRSTEKGICISGGFNLTDVYDWLGEIIDKWSKQEN